MTTEEQLHFSSQSCSHSFSTDFICSGFRVQFLSSVQLLIFTVWSPLWSEQSVKFFLLWGGGCSFTRSGVSGQSPQIGCVCYCQFYQSRSFFTSLRVGLYCVFSSVVIPTFGQRRFVTCTSFCNLRRQFFVTCSVNFCLFGLGFSVSFLYSLAALAGGLPFGTLTMNCCLL